MTKVPSTDSFSPQSDVDPGTYLLNAYSKGKLNEVSVTQYRLDVDGGVSGDRSRFTAAAAYSLDQEHGTPVSTAGTMRVLSARSLSQAVYVWGQRVKAVEEKRITLDPKNPRERETLREFVQSCLRPAVSGQKYDYKFINEIVRREPEFTSEKFASHPQYEVSIQITNEGRVLAHVESGYTLRSRMTLDELYSESDDPQGMKAAHDPERYSTEGQGWLRGWSDLHYNDLIEDAGASVAEMHDGVADEEWRQKLIQDNPRLLKIKYGDNVRNQAPHFLKLAPRIEQVKDEDYDFFQRFMARRSMMPSEKFEYTKEFIENLSWLPVLELEFEPGPTNDGYDEIDIRGTRDRLIFQNNVSANNPSTGLRQHGVYQAPGEYRVGVLLPEAWSEIHQKFPALITKGLAQLQAPAGVTKYEYKLGDISNYTPIAHQLHDETEVVVAVVPDEGASEQFGIEDPHYEVKRTLMRQGVPTQMATKSTVDELLKVGADIEHDKMLNILSAVVGKAGGTPWHIRDSPGKTDAFMGLDVSHDQSSGKHTGASASVVLSDGTTYAAESTVGQSGETFSADHVQQFVRDLVFDFAMEQDTDIDRLCIMRDGKVPEDINAIQEGLSELSAEIDIVGIRKSGQPRVAEYDGTRFRIAQKGVAFVSHEQGYAIVHGSGKPEIKDDNNVGTPQTYRLTQHSGPSDIETLARQAYWLSEVHIGSPVRSPRLPIPIGYADKAAGYVSDEIVSPGTVIKGPAYI
jgi:hypothetical protein